MKFVVSASSTSDIHKLVESYPAIYDYDHEIENPPANPRYPKTFIRLDTLSELIEFQNKVGHGLILFLPDECCDVYELEIYDGYRE